MPASPSAAGRGLARSDLLAVAAELFARQGYRATTLDDIAGELGLKKASLYHYISSKEDLLCEIYQRIFDRVEAAVAASAAPGPAVDERLRRMIHAHVHVVAAERDMLAVVFQEEAELPPEAQAAIRHRKRAHEALFERVIAEGQRQGVIRPGSVRLMVLALLGMCNWVYKWYRPEKFSIEEIAAEFARTLESGVRAARHRLARGPGIPASMRHSSRPSRRSRGRKPSWSAWRQSWHRPGSGFATGLPSGPSARSGRLAGRRRDRRDGAGRRAWPTAAG